MPKHVELGVNIDHVATIRQARKTYEPDPVHAAALAQQAGADGITVHLREDRRHIQDRDLKLLTETVYTRLNLEMALSPEIVKIAVGLKPAQVTLVPENREEVTTEGGLDVVGNLERCKSTVGTLIDAGIAVAMFIEPDIATIDASKSTGASMIEIHTGVYANATGKQREDELERIIVASAYAAGLGMRVNGGHGLTYHNVGPIARVREMAELNIGHSIISRAIFTGLPEAVREMKRLVVEA